MLLLQCQLNVQQRWQQGTNDPLCSIWSSHWALLCSVDMHHKLNIWMPRTRLDISWPSALVQNLKQKLLTLVLWMYFEGQAICFDVFWMCQYSVGANLFLVCISLQDIISGLQELRSLEGSEQCGLCFGLSILQNKYNKLVSCFKILNWSWSFSCQTFISRVSLCLSLQCQNTIP